MLRRWDARALAIASFVASCALPALEKEHSGSGGGGGSHASSAVTTHAQSSSSSSASSSSAGGSGGATPTSWAVAVNSDMTIDVRSVAVDDQNHVYVEGAFSGTMGSDCAQPLMAPTTSRY